jgi:hypothetical protein
MRLLDSLSKIIIPENEVLNGRINSDSFFAGVMFNAEVIASRELFQEKTQMLYHVHS